MCVLLRVAYHFCVVYKSGDTLDCCEFKLKDYQGREKICKPPLPYSAYVLVFVILPNFQIFEQFTEKVKKSFDEKIEMNLELDDIPDEFRGIIRYICPLYVDLVQFVCQIFLTDM